MGDAAGELADHFHFLRFDELGFELFDTGNIMAVFRGSNDLAIPGFDGSNTYGYINEGAIFSPPHCDKGRNQSCRS